MLINANIIIHSKVTNYYCMIISLRDYSKVLLQFLL